MNRRIMGASLAAIAAAAALGMAARPGPDLAATAKTLVNTCGNIKQGEAVLISGTPRDTELLENVAVEVRKLGAFPIITTWSEKLSRRMYDEVPAKYDAQANDFELKFVNLINARISVDATENPALLNGVPAERIAAHAKAEQPLMEASLKRGVRQIGLGNGLYPTEAVAKQYGLSLEQLSTIFWTGVNTDYSKLQNTGETVRATLAAGKEVTVTHANGTNFKVQIASRPAFVSDGVISDDDIAKGGAAVQVWLPAGEVYTTPVPGTAEGTIVADRIFHRGTEITGLTLTFKAGKLTNMTAKTGLDTLKTAYNAAGAGKDEFAFIDIGINPDVKVPANSKLVSWVPAGTVTLGFGGNQWAGGANACPFDVPVFLPGSTLKVDNKTLIENGTLKP